MLRNFTLEYWEDDGWFVGKLLEIPNVVSQGSTLDELVENIKDAYTMMKEEDTLTVDTKIFTKEIEVNV